MAEQVILPFITKKLNKRLSSDEIKYISNKIKNITFNKNNIGSTVNTLIDDIKTGKAIINIRNNKNVNTISAEPNKLVIENQREYTLQKLNESDEEYENIDRYNEALTLEVAEFFTYKKDDLFALSKCVNPASKEYYSYIMFDSFNKRTDLSTETRFVWELNDSGLAVERTGVINLPHKLNNIIRMRLGRVSVNNIDYDEFSKIFNTETNRFAFYFENFKSQSLISPDGNNFHFLAKNDTRLRRGNCFTLSTFDENRGWFRFHKPHRNTDELILNMYDIFTPTAPIAVGTVPVSIDATATVGVTIDSSWDPAFTKFYNPVIVSATPADLYNMMTTVFFAPGDTQTENVDGPSSSNPVTYTISGFTTADPVADAAFIAAYNTSNWTAVLEGDHLYFEPPVDPNTAVPPLTLGGGKGGSYIPITITWNVSPRLLGVLEVVSRMEPGDKIT